MANMPTTVAPAVNPVAQTPIINPSGVAAPQTGLIGSEQALAGGLAGGINAINSGVTTARNDINSGIAGIDQNSAGKLQADLTGANGPQAQAAARLQFSQSPAAQYQQDQMQRAVERSAAAKGGLLGGNTLTELQRNAAGIACQDYQNQFANLGTVADRTLQQNTLKANLKRDLADTAMSAGIQTGGLIAQTAGQVAQGRENAGYAIAKNATDAASNISSLLDKQGIVVSDAMAKDISTITDMIYQSGVQDSHSSEQLAAILANIAGGQASTVAQGQAQIGASNAAGTIGIANAVNGGITQGISSGILKV
jgi:hypothetical protein